MRRPLFALLALGLALPVVAARAQSPLTETPGPTHRRPNATRSRTGDVILGEPERPLRLPSSGRFTTTRGPRATDPSVGGKYRGLLATLDAPEDREAYGNFNDWGFWEGTSYKSYHD